VSDNSKRIGPDTEFWHQLNAGKFMIQRSRSTGQYVFYPRMRAPGSGADDLEWVEASGAGEVHAVTIIPRKPERGGTYNIALVELAEGPRMMTRIVGVDPEAVTIGMPVRAKIIQPDFGSLKGGDQNLVVFEPDVERSNG